MYRCAFIAVAACVASAPALAQGHRFFPSYALRGDLVVLQWPDATLNGQAARLAPGARIRDAADMLAQPASLSGQKLVVHYTIEPTSGLLRDVWVLNAAELANKTWPRTALEAATWSFDRATQTWTKP